MTIDEARPTSGTAGPPPRIRLRGLVKCFYAQRGAVQALDNVSIDIAASEKLVLLGPSGCGKTTLLRCIAGLEAPDEGDIEIDGQLVFASARGIAVPPERRSVSMVFQSYALWPHMTVFDNIAYPLTNTGVAKADIRDRVAAVLRTVHCDGLALRYPGQLSGGQQQRVSLARAIVGREGTILFDEPLSNVDAKVREELRVELVGLQKQIGFTAVYVTHDQSEASAFAHRIAVMEAGRIVQLGSPRQIYESPMSRFVATFTGATNAIAGTLVGRDGDEVIVDTRLGRLRAAAGIGLDRSNSVEALCRPEHLRFAAASDGNSIAVVVESAMFHGLLTEYSLLAGEVRLVLRTVEVDGPAEGDRVYVAVDPIRLRVFPAPSNTSDTTSGP